MKKIFFVILFLIIATTAQAKVVTQEIEYSGGGAKLKGFLAYDDAVSAKRPGILVVHEWWGHNEHARNRAQMLAKLGYTALALDMYGDGKVADHPKQAGEFMTAAMQQWDASKEKFEKALETLKAHTTVDASRIGAIGFCFGGQVILRMARGGAELAGAVAFHSGLPAEPPISADGVKTPLLVINGSADDFISPESVSAFMGEMAKANADITYMSLKGVKHSFTNQKADEFNKKFNLPALVYDKQADERSWRAMQDFFKRVFGKK